MASEDLSEEKEDVVATDERIDRSEVDTLEVIEEAIEAVVEIIIVVETEAATVAAITTETDLVVLLPEGEIEEATEETVEAETTEETTTAHQQEREP